MIYDFYFLIIYSQSIYHKRSRTMFIFLFITNFYNKVSDLIIEESQNLKKKKNNCFTGIPETLTANLWLFQFLRMKY